MLRQVYIINDDNIVYERNYGKAIGKEEFMIVFKNIKNMAFSLLRSGANNIVYFNYNISYFLEKKSNLFFILITDLSDIFKYNEIELKKLKNKFLEIFSDFESESLDSSLLVVLNPIVDVIHRSLKPKISLIGFSGVGKTTITKLIKEDEIPMTHIPTITGDRTSIKIGNLEFTLWDFAGQEQFSYLWNRFIKGSNVVFLITDSTLENVEKSKFFIELMRTEAPDSYGAVIANKQDLLDALKPERIERMLGIKTYSMVAINPRNRERMIQIIADVLNINTQMSPLLKTLFEKDLLILDAENAFKRGDYEKAVSYYEKVSDICLELGDDSLGKGFYEKAQKLKEAIHQGSSESTALESENSVSEVDIPVTKVESPSSELEKLVSEEETPITKVEALLSELETLVSGIEVPVNEEETPITKVKTQSSEREKLVSEVETPTTKEETQSSELKKLISEIETSTTKEETQSSERETLVSEVETPTTKEETLTSELKKLINDIETSTTKVETQSSEREKTSNEVEKPDIEAEKLRE